MTEKDAVLAANAAYYQAFETGDFTRMSAVWAADEISCIHPGWPVLLGRRAVLESYRSIFSNPNQERIAHHGDMVLISGSEARVFCVELVGGMRLAATNWFRREADGWRMIHHQASPIALMVEEAATPPAGQRLN